MMQLLPFAHPTPRLHAGVRPVWSVSSEIATGYGLTEQGAALAWWRAETQQIFENTVSPRGRRMPHAAVFFDL